VGIVEGNMPAEVVIMFALCVASQRTGARGRHRSPFDGVRISGECCVDNWEGPRPGGNIVCLNQVIR
jgi:hypothetical protein